MAAARPAATEAQAKESEAARVLLGERHALEACRNEWSEVLKKL